MNAAEHIVEAYYRYVENCFTIADRKVISGNNRQMDFLAYNMISKKQYHIEVSVTHSPNWSETLDQQKPKLFQKFLGIPAPKKSSSGNPTDSERGKNFFASILTTYEGVGFDPALVERIYVEWVIKEAANQPSLEYKLINPNDGKEYSLLVLSMREHILPRLAATIKTSNYDDEILRTISLLTQWEKQTEKSLIDHSQY